MTDITSDSRKALVSLTEWPEAGEDATADALILCSARQATANHALGIEWLHRADDVDRDTPAGDGERRRRNRLGFDHLGQFVTDSQVAYLLATIQKTDRALADDLARRLWDATEDGGLFGELGWEWLQNRGIDANEAWKIAQASAAAEVAAEIERSGRA